MCYGIKIIRFWDEDVYYDLDNVLRVIEITVEERKGKVEEAWTKRSTHL